MRVRPAAGEIESDRLRPWTLSPSLDFFRRVFGQQEFGRWFVSGLVVAGRVVIVPALTAFLAATAVTRFRFRFRTTLLITLLVARTVSVAALAIPLFFQMRGFVKGDPFPARPVRPGGHDPVFLHLGLGVLRTRAATPGLRTGRSG